MRNDGGYFLGACGLLGRRWRFSLLVVAGLSLGCSSPVSHSALSPVIAVEEVAATDQAAPAPAGGFVLEHSFGVVKPDAKLLHRFAIKNDGAANWTIKTIHVTCSCTAPTASSFVIRPSSSEWIEVHFHVGKQSNDTVKSLLVEFTEPGIAPVRLVVKANVREPLTAMPRELVFSGVGDSAEGRLDVHNFSAGNWKSLKADSSEPWLRADFTLLPTDPGSDATAPRQAWRAVVRVNGASLPPGSHGATLTLSGGDSPESRLEIPVQISVSAPVQLIPPRFFFGAIVPGQVGECRVKLLFAEPREEEFIRAIAFRHELGDALAFRWERRNERAWELTALLTATGGRRFMEGTLAIEFPNQELASLEAPISAKISGGDDEPVQDAVE